MQTSWIRGAVVSMLLGPEAELAAAAAAEPSHVPLETFIHRMETDRSGSSDCARSWQAGETLTLSLLGPLGEAVSRRRTLGDALRTLARGFPVLQTNSFISVETIEDEVHVGYRVLDPRIWPRRADAELTLGLIRGVCGRYGVPREAIRGLSFEHQPDRDLRGLFQHIGHAADFGQEENRIILSARAMSCTRVVEPDGDTDSAHWLKTVDAALTEQRRHTPVSHRVSELILRQIGRQAIDQHSIALQLGLSERSLRRALAAEGRSFHDILEQCRRTQGFALLVRSDRQFGEIALLLGYSDQTAFSRAFSRWYGAPPRELRRLGGVEESVIR